MGNKDFIDSYKQIAKKAIQLSEKARRKGLLALEDIIDDAKFKERDIFECGIRFIVDGTDRVIIEKILSNIINQEKDESARILKTIQKDVILAIQEGMNSHLMRHLINSYTDLTLNEDEIFLYDD